MKSVLEKIYLDCPILLQNFLVTLKGYSLNKIRHGGYYQNYFEEISSRKSWSIQQFNDYQKNQLKKLITNAYNFVPFYSNLYRKIGIKPNDIRTVEDIKRLPIITKKDIKNNPHEFIDQRFNNKKLIQLHTTGTTGTPLQISTDKIAIQWNFAFFNAYLTSFGLDTFSAKTATFGGRTIVPSIQGKPPFWRYSLFQKNLLFSSYHLKNEYLSYYVDKLKTYRPDIIDAYPSSIYIVAKFMLDNNISGIFPKVIVTSAETLFDEQRTVIESAFKCKVADQYGSAEMNIFVGQCKSGNYHIRPDYGVVEFLKDDKTSKPGEMGEIICTGFLNTKMPLIRYAIGDYGIPSDKFCSCGLNTPIMENIQGRMDDAVITKTGTPIGRLSPILKGFPVVESLYIQENPGELIVLIVKEKKYHEQDSVAIIGEIRKRVGNDMIISLKFVNKIDRSGGAKNRAVISKIKSARN